MLASVVRVAAGIAALGALLGGVLGVSRTAMAMARDRHLPAPLAAVHPITRTPYVAELCVGVLVAAIVLVADVRQAIGFSSFEVLIYYLVANAAALRLDRRHGDCRPGCRCWVRSGAWWSPGVCPGSGESGASSSSSSAARSMR
ncbi:hypothetical protein BFG51_17810 [Dietzia alimentaria]|nr:hypothetical protein BFG51_17810 [Dietzia alimentaria]